MTKKIFNQTAVLFSIVFLFIYITSCSNESKKTIKVSDPVNKTVINEASTYFDKLNQLKKERKINVAFLVYDQVESMDLNGPIDVFSKANEMDSVYNLYTVSASSEKLVPAEGSILFMKTTYSFDNAPQADILVVPGAGGAIIQDVYENQPNLMNWIIKQNENTILTMSVCTGAIILSKAKILDNKQVTTHNLMIEELQKNKNIEIVENVRFVQDGKIITAAGITSGLDAALYVVEQINGKNDADYIAKLLVYDRNGNMDFLAK